MPARSRLPRLPLAIVVSLLLVAIAAPGAAASNGKQFVLDITPEAVSAGAGNVTASATFTNPPDARQQLGSANLTVPPGFVMRSALIGTRRVTIKDDVTALARDLSLAPGSSVTVTMSLAVPCDSDASPEWTVVAKQANDFKGTGNDIALWREESDTSTDVTGACELRWKDTPKDARVGETITTRAYDQAAAPSTVAVYDGNGNVISSATGGVTLSFGLSSGFGSLSGGSSSLVAGTGIASFGALEISGPGTYSLIAEVTSGRFDGLRSAPSPRFLISTIATQCEAGVNCVGSLPSGQTRFRVDALAAGDAPLLTLSLDAGLRLSSAHCGGWVGYTDGTALFDVTSSRREKLISLTVGRKIMNFEPDNGAPRMELCFASPVAFYAKGSSTLTTPSTLTFDWDRDGDDDPVYLGLLPDCPGRTGHPCVTQRKKVSGGDGFIEARLPPSLTDPAMRG